MLIKPWRRTRVILIKTPEGAEVRLYKLGTQDHPTIGIQAPLAFIVSEELARRCEGGDDG